MYLGERARELLVVVVAAFAVICVSACENKTPPVEDPKIETEEATDRSDPEAVARAFIIAVANNKVEEAAQLVIAEERDEIRSEMAKGLPPFPTDPEIEVRVKDDGVQADVRILNAKPAVPGGAPFGLDLRLSEGEWWIVK